MVYFDDYYILIVEYRFVEKKKKKTEQTNFLLFFCVNNSILVENISKFVENNVIKWKFYNCFPVFVCIMRLKFTKLHVLYDFFQKKEKPDQML